MAHPASRVFYASQTWRDLRAAVLRRDAWCCVVPGCGQPATHVDHKRARPHSATLTTYDCMANLRSLCAAHDAQVKELAGGERRNGGAFRLRGCDVQGWPLDPARGRGGS